MREMMPMNDCSLETRWPNLGSGAFILSISALFVAACSLPFVGNDAPGWLNAYVTGDVQETFRGDGNFAKNLSDEFWTLSVWSRGEDGRSMPTGFLLIGFHVKDPETRTYPLSIGTDAEVLGGSEPLFAVVYSRMNDAGDNGEAYRSESGEVTFESVSGGRIVGRFTFVGFEHCPGGPEVFCPGSPPSAPPEGARVIEVTGTFEARPSQS